MEILAWASVVFGVLIATVLGTVVGRPLSDQKQLLGILRSRIVMPWGLLVLSGIMLLFGGYLLSESSQPVGIGSLRVPRSIVDVLDRALASGVLNGADAANLNKWMNHEVRGTPRQFSIVHRSVVLATPSGAIFKLARGDALEPQERLDIPSWLAAHHDEDISDEIRTLLVARLHEDVKLSSRERSLLLRWHDMVYPHQHVLFPSPSAVAGPVIPLAPDGVATRDAEKCAMLNPSELPPSTDVQSIKVDVDGVLQLPGMGRRMAWIRLQTTENQGVKVVAKGATRALVMTIYDVATFSCLSEVDGTKMTDESLQLEAQLHPGDFLIRIHAGGAPLPDLIVSALPEEAPAAAPAPAPAAARLRSTPLFVLGGTK